MNNLLSSQPAACPKCGRPAKLYACLRCNGTGKVLGAKSGKWSRQTLLKNPFLPYYKSPPATPADVECATCHGKGKVVVCAVCGVLPIPTTT